MLFFLSSKNFTDIFSFLLQHLPLMVPVWEKFCVTDEANKKSFENWKRHVSIHFSHMKSRPCGICGFEFKHPKTMQQLMKYLFVTALSYAEAPIKVTHRYFPNINVTPSQWLMNDGMAFFPQNNCFCIATHLIYIFFVFSNDQRWIQVISDEYFWIYDVKFHGLTICFKQTYGKQWHSSYRVWIEVLLW